MKGPYSPPTLENRRGLFLLLRYGDPDIHKGVLKLFNEALHHITNQLQLYQAMYKIFLNDSAKKLEAENILKLMCRKYGGDNVDVWIT